MYRKSLRILVVFFCLLATLVVLTGCSLLQVSKEKNPQITVNPSNNTPPDTNANQPDSTPPDTNGNQPDSTPPEDINESPSIATNPAETPNNASPDKSAGSNYQKGTVTETTFYSEYLNLRFEAQEGYIMATTEDLDALLDYGNSIVNSDKDKKIIDYAMANTVYEMMVSAPNGFPNAQVLVEKLGLTNMTATQYGDALKQQLDGVEDFDYSFGDVETRQFVGESYLVLPSMLKMGDITINQEYFYRKKDNRIVCIIVTFNDECIAEKEELLNSFMPY